MSKTKTLRVVAAEDGYADDAMSLALSYVRAIQKSLNSAGEIILLTHTKGELSGTTLAGMVGVQAAKALHSGKSVNTPVGPMRHATLRTIGYSVRNAIVVAFYANEKMLDELDSKPGVAGIVTVPHLKGDADGWARRWDATVHGKKKDAPKPLISDPVIASAMKTLTVLSNTSYGSLNARDTQHADEIFRILRNKGHDLNPGQIKDWAIRAGWHPGAADGAAKVARKIGSLKAKPSVSKFYNPDARYDRWKADD